MDKQVPQIAATDRSKITVLNVNDTDAIRYVLTRTLKSAGYTVVEAVNGRDAIKSSALHPDLILLDVRLPDIHGFEVCETIKNDPGTAHIPIIMISANYVQRVDVEAGLQKGADGYLTHPIPQSDLLLALEAVLDVRRNQNV